MKTSILRCAWGTSREDSQLAARKLAEMEEVGLYAAPDYLKRCGDPAIRSADRRLSSGRLIGYSSHASIEALSNLRRQASQRSGERMH